MDIQKIKAINAIRQQLRHGDLTRIADEYGYSRPHVSKCMNPDDDTFDEGVIMAAKEYIIARNARIKNTVAELKQLI